MEIMTIKTDTEGAKALAKVLWPCLRDNGGSISWEDRAGSVPLTAYIDVHPGEGIRSGLQKDQLGRIVTESTHKAGMKLSLLLLWLPEHGDPTVTFKFQSPSRHGAKLKNLP